VSHPAEMINNLIATTLETFGAVSAFVLFAAVVISAIYYISRYQQAYEKTFFNEMDGLGFVLTSTNEPSGCLGIKSDPSFEPLKSTLEGFGAQALVSIGTLSITTQFARIRPGNKCYLFEVKKVVSSGKSTSVTYHGYAVFELPLLLPTLTIRSETGLDKMASWLGIQDIQFESEEFNQKYNIKSSDDKLAHAVIDPQMIEFLMSQAGVNTQLFSHFMLFEFSKSDWPKIDQGLGHFVHNFIEKVPDYIKKERSFTSQSVLLVPNEFAHQAKLLQLNKTK